MPSGVDSLLPRQSIVGESLFVFLKAFYGILEEALPLRHPC